MIKTSILIPTKNGARDIEACLEAIYSQKHVGHFEVLVVDSGSTDATLEIVRRYPARIERIPPEAFHHARTRNAVAYRANGEFLVFLSQDAIPASETWLMALLKNFEDVQVGAVYGRQLPKPDSGLERRSVFSALYGDARIVKMPMDGVGLGYKYYHFSNANSAIRKKVWEVTRFPEDLKVFEDVGIAKRILDAGWRIVYEPDAVALHSAPSFGAISISAWFTRESESGTTIRGRFCGGTASMRSKANCRLCSKAEDKPAQGLLWLMMLENSSPCS